MKRILITGGAGFIGSHVADVLLQSGYEVRVLDNLCDQVHDTPTIPGYLAPEVECIQADVRNADAVGDALRNVDGVIHFAAAVGVGQSMYELVHYTSVNNLGTAVLLEALIKQPVQRLVVASSMSIYGEGMYRDSQGRLIESGRRPAEQLRRGTWEVMQDSEALTPVPTPETKRPALSSVYALSKYDQERLCLMIGEAYNIPSVALRFFNVYGPRQALSNPYTGVLAIFASRLLNDRRPLIFEDGKQRRDFVSVYDVARACECALEQTRVSNEVFNVGSGQSQTIEEVAYKLAVVLGKDIEPEITGRYRTGDIRHCYADVTKAAELLGYRARESFSEALEELADWLKDQKPEDRSENAQQQLLARGLAI